MPIALYESRTKGNGEYSLSADAMRGRAAIPSNSQSELMPYTSPSVLNKNNLNRINRFRLFLVTRTEPTFAFGEIGGGGNPFARSATSLGASPHHLPKATSFEATPWPRSFVPLRGNDVLASLDNEKSTASVVLCTRCCV